jgi:aryl-alcohol dehydrogenase-like predicted oxidoreductase
MSGSQFLRPGSLLKKYDEINHPRLSIHETTEVVLMDESPQSALKNKNVEIHTRSAFLQGVLLDFDNLPKHFKTWEKQFNEYQAMIKESGMSLLEYALNFALNIPEIDKVLVGVNSERQLKEIVQAVKGPSSLGAYPIDDINLLNPSLWKV